ncbi:11160_t:CDS:2 [Dentiscutata heterogama]|uniref:11160_t:CDS:1 n=1 Tax=Dentiscutata heterogama TaxID=1316150 RepID=A0ACA9M4F0_9GLOM|nr:11160_t:CDS:2 [Dentiscutata heterogama]
MSKKVQVAITLVESGIIDENYHYGPFSFTGYSTISFLPGYQCSCNNILSEIVDNPSMAIFTVYTNLFKTKTHYSGPLIIGKIKIFVFEIGSSLQQNLKKRGSGYKSSLIHEYHSKNTLFVSTIDDLNYSLKIYQDFQLINHIKKQTPNEFFVNWAKNKSKIIELVTSLQEIYLARYQFTNREFSAWQTLIWAASGYNITP